MDIRVNGFIITTTIIMDCYGHALKTYAMHFANFIYCKEFSILIFTIIHFRVTIFFAKMDSFAKAAD